ncbi:MAG: hypothetical protein QG597_370, partial [Actinomycetota bacterium]|nr:hypothetical protein [Actinomycetota bacterium]
LPTRGVFPRYQSQPSGTLPPVGKLTPIAGRGNERRGRHRTDEIGR